MSMAYYAQQQQQQQQQQHRPHPNRRANPPHTYVKKGNTRYKTELCRAFSEKGFCKYGDKCQFAHGEPELRAIPRHPKYKTELCRTFHTTSYCPYGQRCHFIHDPEKIPPDVRQRALNAVKDDGEVHLQRSMSQPATPSGYPNAFTFSQSSLESRSLADSGTFSDSDTSSPEPSSPGRNAPATPSSSSGTSRVSDAGKTRSTVQRSLSASIAPLQTGSFPYPPQGYQNVPLPFMSEPQFINAQSFDPNVQEFVPSGAFSAGPHSYGQSFTFDETTKQYRPPSLPNLNTLTEDQEPTPSWLSSQHKDADHDMDHLTQKMAQTLLEEEEPSEVFEEESSETQSGPPSPTRRLPVFTNLSAGETEPEHQW